MFRILALDGGGIKGTYTAAVLEQFEEQLGGPVVDHFDLIVGTSTGGIIGLGLACGRTAQELLQFYIKEGSTIFPPAQDGWTGLVEWMFGSKYESGDLKKVLSDYLPDRRFSALKHNVAITSFDASCARPVVFKTKYHRSLNAHSDLTVVDVAMATSAAPTYFDAANTGCGTMIDGGVWANCPVMVGVIDALTLFGQNVDDIHVLSIGTTSIPTFVSPEARKGGLLQWARPATSLLMHAAKLGAIEQAMKLCRKLVRIDSMAAPGQFALDDTRQMEDLQQRGWNDGRNRWNEVARIFFKDRPAPSRRRKRASEPTTRKFRPRKSARR